MKKALVLLLVALLTGCGYSTRSLLPSNYKTICVQPFENKIDYMNDVERKLYIPGLENTVREAIVDRYQFDGNLHIAPQETADLILKGKLLSFERNDLRVNNDQSVREYRIRVTVSLVLEDPVGKKDLWTEPSFSGEATYFTSGSMAKSEAQAMDEALKDLAQRAVARTIEAW